MDDILQAAREGSAAAAAGDKGRSSYLIQQVTNAMQELTLDECEWLSVAVTNGAFSKSLSEHAQPDDLDSIVLQSNQKGEVWDI